MNIISKQGTITGQSKKASRSQLREYEARISRIPEVDLAWFAGWLCADGSIKKADERNRPKLSFQICDRDPLEQMTRLFGGTVGGPFPPSGLGKLPRYSWSISGWKAVFILRRCLPWLSERCLEKANRALELFKIQRDGGNKLSFEDVEEIRKKLQNGYGSGRIIAKEFGVSVATISAIRSGRIWNEPVLRPRLYLLGKMTGLPYFGFPAFDEARDQLNSFGKFEVISPADMDRKAGLDPSRLPPDYDWTKIPSDFDLWTIIRKDINVVLTVDCYAALDNWKTSKGATAEKALCDWRGIPRIDWRTGEIYVGEN